VADLFEDIFTLDRRLHEPAHLAILTVLSACRFADFRFLESITGIPQANLSGHLTRLEAAGLLVIEKRFRKRRAETRVRATPEGRRRITEHWRELKRLSKAANKWALMFRRRVAVE
jgi:DNA-binding MarR family transcriptional regulator